MAVSISATMTLEYTDATSRNVTFDGLSAEALATYKARVIALNNTIADTVTGAAYKDTFISDAGAPISKIKAAKYTVTEESVIYSG